MPRDIDPGMMELLTVLGAATNPHRRRRAHENFHTTYYSQYRYKRL